MVTPEPKRERDVGSSADQLSRLAGVFDVVSKGIKYLDFHSKRFALNLCMKERSISEFSWLLKNEDLTPGVDWQRRAACHDCNGMSILEITESGE